MVKKIYSFGKLTEGDNPPYAMTSVNSLKQPKIPTGSGLTQTAFNRIKPNEYKSAVSMGNPVGGRSRYDVQYGKIGQRPFGNSMPKNMPKPKPTQQIGLTNAGKDYVKNIGDVGKTASTLSRAVSNPTDRKTAGIAAKTASSWTFGTKAPAELTKTIQSGSKLGTALKWGGRAVMGANLAADAAMAAPYVYKAGKYAYHRGLSGVATDAGNLTKTIGRKIAAADSKRVPDLLNKRYPNAGKLQNTTFAKAGMPIPTLEADNPNLPTDPDTPSPVYLMPIAASGIKKYSPNLPRIPKLPKDSPVIKKSKAVLRTSARVLADTGKTAAYLKFGTPLPDSVDNFRSLATKGGKTAKYLLKGGRALGVGATVGYLGKKAYDFAKDNVDYSGPSNYQSTMAHMIPKNNNAINRKAYDAAVIKPKLAPPLSEAYVSSETIRRLYEDDADHQETLDKTGFWGKQGAGAIIMAQDTGRILVPKRSLYVQEPDTWGVWGGAIEDGENPLEAAKREIHEESGYTGKLLDVIPLYVFKKNSFRYYNYLIIIEHEFEPKLDWETAQAKWFTLDELPSPLHFGFQAVLRDPKSIEIIKKYSYGVNK